MGSRVSRAVFLLSLLPIALFVTACFSDQRDAPVIEIGTRWSIADAKDLPTLVSSSDAIFLGTVVELQGQELRKLAPDHAPASPEAVAGKPAVRREMPELPISFFSVRVVQALLGTPRQGDLVVIAQGGGTIERQDGSEVEVVLESDELLKPGEAYVFFAQNSNDGTKNFTTSPIRRIGVEKNGRLKANGVWAKLGAMRELSGLDRGQAAAGILRAAGEASH